MKDKKSIFIFSATTGIGDTIMAIPMLRLLHQKMPEADIVLGLGSRGAGQLFETCPFIRKVIRFETKLVRRNLELILMIRRNWGFDVSMTTCIAGYPHLSIASVMAKCVKARQRVGFSFPATKESLFPFFLTHLLDDTITIDFSKHYVIQNVELLKFLGIYPDNEIPQMELWLTEEDITAAEKFLMGHRIEAGDMLIGIHPGSSRWIMKQWPKEKFAALIDSLRDEYRGVKVLIFGGPDEEELKHNVADLVKTPVKPIVVAVMPLRKTAALIERCNLFIANDSSLMHVATAVKTPVVGIFGPTNPLTTGPYSRKSAVVTNRVFSCQPCYNSKERFAPIRFTCRQNLSYACLTQLPVSDVLESAKRLLNQR